ncbi:MAG: DUF6531 domain-containing protein, partial [Sulfuricaulis sp.]
MNSSFGRAINALTQGFAAHLASRLRSPSFPWHDLASPMKPACSVAVFSWATGALLLFFSLWAQADCIYLGIYPSAATAEAACNCTDEVGHQPGTPSNTDAYTNYVINPGGCMTYWINVSSTAYPSNYYCPTISYVYGAPTGPAVTCSVPATVYTQQKNAGPPAPGKCTGDPCDAGSGNEYQAESDYRSTNTTLSLTRSYNSQFAEDFNIGLGYGWTAPFLRNLQISGSSVQVFQATGRGEPFTCTNDVCTGDADTQLALEQDAAGYTLTYRDGATDRYNTTGQLVSETSTTGQTTNYAYNSSNQLATVTDPFGHTLTFGYDTGNHVISVTDPAGNTIYYYYLYSNLTKVIYPDLTGKVYYYEDTNNPHNLTGIADYVYDGNSATRYSTYGYFYDSGNISDPNNGKAILTQLTQTENGSPQQSFTLAYNSATQTTVTNPVGMQNVLTFNRLLKNTPKRSSP